VPAQDESVWSGQIIGAQGRSRLIQGLDAMCSLY